MPELDSLVDSVGGTESLAGYLDVSPELIETALAAPEGSWTDRVCRMVYENTEKLLGMPSQGGFFWRVTRRRVVKDWVLLARWGEARGAPGHASDATPSDLPTRVITNEQRETFDYALAEALVVSDEQHGEPSIDFDGDLFVVAIPLPADGREAMLRYEIRPDGSFRTSHNGATPSDWLPPRGALDYLLKHSSEDSDSEDSDT